MKYKVPFVNYPLQYRKLKKELKSAMEGVLLKGDLILRADVERFEKRLANFVGSKYAVSLNSGTDALFLSLIVSGVGKGDEVITVSHTFVASIAAIVQCGAVPQLVEVRDDYVMDVDAVEKAITEKTKAIMPVHFNGRMCNMGKIMAIAKRHNLLVIEDAAQALGASFKGKGAGSIGLTGCFSFYPAKILGCFGDGGALTTNNAAIAKKVCFLRDHGHKTKTEIVGFGWNSRLDNIQAAVLNVKLKYLPQQIKRRRVIAALYDKGLSGVKTIKRPLAPNADARFFDVYQNYVLRAQKRNTLFSFLQKKGVETLIKDPVPTHWHKGLHLSRFHLPFTEQLAKEVISLPMYPELTNEQIDYVVSGILDFYT